MVAAGGAGGGWARGSEICCLQKQVCLVLIYSKEHIKVDFLEHDRTVMKLNFNGFNWYGAMEIRFTPSVVLLL